MRSVVTLACLLGESGCGGGATTAVTSICRAGDKVTDADVFARLTASSWYSQGTCESGAPLPPTCNRLRLSADGTYSWRAVSDYEERGDAGSWNFFARDDRSGVVCLDNGSVVDFALPEDGNLLWGMLGELEPEAPLGGSGIRAALPQIAVTPLFTEMTAHDWRRTNEMDVFRLPTSVSLSDDGTFAASYRDGECQAAGTFSLILDNLGFEFWPRGAPNTCDLRDGGTTAQLYAGIVPTIADGILHLYNDSYRDAAIQTEQRYLAFSSYGSVDAGLFVTAEWNNPIVAGAPTTWAMTLQNQTAKSQTVTSLRITQTPLTMTTNGFTYAGPTAVVVDRDLSGLTLGSMDSHAVDVAFTLTAAEWTILEVLIESADASQPYHNRESFVLTL